jgi:carboxylesterase
MSVIKKRKRVIWIVVLILVIILLSGFLGLIIRTGFLQTSTIDKRDLAYWNYENGLIKGEEAFILNGSNETCWYLIHGYTSTPRSMKELAINLNNEFNESVFVTRLEGHAQVPSKILNLTLDDWYSQVEMEYDELEIYCENINVVGFSFGGALGLKLSQEKQVNNLYLISPYLFATHKPVRIFTLESYLDFVSDWVTYTKKSQIAQLNDPIALKEHIAYWNMPLLPVKYSKYFLKSLRENIGKTSCPVLVQQSKNDKTSDMGSSYFVFENVNSSKKEIIVFEKSNHVLLEDFDKSQAINNIINFEKEIRENGE